MKKSGFTIIELLATIIIVGVLSTIAVFSYNRVIDNSRNKAFKNNEKSLKTAAENLLTYCMNTIDNPDYCVEIPDKDEIIKIDIDKMINGKFIEKISDPSNNGLFCDTSYVEVTNKTSGATNLEYKTCLICHNYKSSGC